MKLFFILMSIVMVALAGYLFILKSEIQQPEAFEDRVHTPEEQLAGFTLPEGFVIELVASEKDGVINPVDLTFDDAGRLWTQTATMYPLDPIADIKWNNLLDLMNDSTAQQNDPNFKRVRDLFLGKTKGVDKILILSDLYRKEQQVKTTVWADSLTIPMSILPYKDGAYVAQGSELFFLNDVNKDGAADRREPLLSGFGFTDTHTMAHALVRGPGGWIHFSHGGLNKGNVYSHHSDVRLSINYSKIVRFSMDAKKLELENSGLNNIWGFQLRSNGQWYATEANDLGYSVIPLEAGAGFGGIGNDRLRAYQPWMPELQKFRVGGTGLSGLAFPDDLDGSFPEEWKNVGFLANPITNSINAVRAVRNPDGTVSTAHLPDLLTSKDKFFRPVNLEFGPDGCLYVADWYNKIISHNETPTSHPDRDKTHGRIWRIRHVGQRPREVPNFYDVPVSRLVDYLKSPSIWHKRAAWHQIEDRPVAEIQHLIPALVALASDTSKDDPTRIHALWCLEGLMHFDDRLMNNLLSDRRHDIRREAVRSLATFALTPAQVSLRLKRLADDVNPMIRSQVLRTLTDLGDADSSSIAILLDACKPEIEGNQMGGSYERRFERYLALKALEQYPNELDAYLQSSGASQIPVVHKLWAINALPTKQKEKWFIDLWPSANLKKLDEPNFVTIAKMIGNQKIYKMVSPVMEDPAQARKYLEWSLKNQQALQSVSLSVILKRPAETLLKSASATEHNLALEATGRLKINISRKSILKLIKNSVSSQTIGLAINALDSRSKENAGIFAQIAVREEYPFDLRVSALQSLSIANTDSAWIIVGKIVPDLNAYQKKKVVSVLSLSDQGSVLLANAFRKKIIDVHSFDLSAAERFQKRNPEDPLHTEILNKVKQKMDEEKLALQSKRDRYIDISRKKEGNIKNGKILFQTCLMCHRVGNGGQDIAPALDGSASRSHEALLSSILDPNAAVERGYALYQVTKNDNSVVEGFLYNRDGYGITLSFMGGSRIFIQFSDIKSSGFLPNRSFMPMGLIDDYTEDQVADLLAYIRTL